MKLRRSLSFVLACALVLSLLASWLPMQTNAAESEQTEVLELLPADAHFFSQTEAGAEHWPAQSDGSLGSINVSDISWAKLTYESITSENLWRAPYFSYTVDVPADGYYEMVLDYQMGNASTSGYFIVRVDGMNFKQNFVNETAQAKTSHSFGVWLTKGTHALTVTCPMEVDGYSSGYPNWFNVYKLTISGGVSVSESRIDPASCTDAVTFEAEDAVMHNYTASTSGGKSGGVAGSIKLNHYETYMQSYAQMAGEGWVDKTSLPYVTYLLDAEEAGTYTLQYVYHVVTNTDYSVDDYKMTVSVNDKTFTQVAYQPYANTDTNDGWAIAQLQVELTQGRNVIRMISATSENLASLNWLDQDYLRIAGPGAVTAVAEDTLIVYFAEGGDGSNGDASNYMQYVNGYTVSGTKKSLSGMVDNAGLTYDTVTSDNLSSLPYFAYTVNVPENGYYDMEIGIATGKQGNEGYCIVMVDGEMHKAYVQDTAAAVNNNTNNLTTYLTAGTHTVLVSALREPSISGGWCNFRQLVVRGGVTQAANQVDPAAFTVRKEGQYITRLEAESDGVIGRYTTTTETGKSGTVVGGLNKDTTYMQTFQDMQERGLVDKSGIPYVSYMVNVPADGTYTLRSVYKVAMNTGYAVEDYYMTASVNDQDFYQLPYAAYQSDTSGWAQSEAEVTLKKGYNVIRMISVNADNTASVSWLNQDYIEIIGTKAVTAVTQTANYFQSGEAEYYNGYTTVNSGSTYDWAKSYLGGIERIQMNYDVLDHTTIYELAWVSYTLQIPADGYYDMHTTINTGSAATGYIIMMVDGEKYQMPVAEVTEGFKKNKQNLTTYLTEGTHTILVSAICGSSATWCDIAALTVYGEGVKLAENQIDPVTLIKVPEGLVDGSAYTLAEGVLTVSTNVNVLTLKSNLHSSENITVTDAQGNVLADTDTVPDGAVVKYASGTEYTVETENTYDANSDTKIDIRDLKPVNEAVLSAQENASAADVAMLEQEILTGIDSYQRNSLGADAILELCNPVGRLIKQGSALYMEASASNFTLAGDMYGDVYVTLMHGHGINDANVPGIFVEIDGETVNYIELPVWYEKQTVKVASGLEAGEHTIQISKSVDSKNGGLYIYSVSYTGEMDTAEAKARKIQFVGDSITAGFGVVTKSYDPIGIVTDGVYTNKTYSYYSYANTVADTLNADYYSIANGGWYFSSSESADIEDKSITRIYDLQSMLMDLGEYDAVNAAWKPDVVVVNLGTNDATLIDSDGNLVISEEQYMTDVAALLDQVRAANPDAAIVWAYGAMGTTSNMPDGDKAEWIQAAIEAYNADKTEAMQVTYVALPTYQDGLWSHPSIDGQKVIGQTLAEAIAELMGWN